MTRALEEMVEPLEETRNELIFATEPVLSSLHMSIPPNSHHTPIVELDEIEVRSLLFLYFTEITQSRLDSKGYPSNMQGTLVSALVSTLGTLQSET